jgi:hypothetical protein
MWDGVLRGGDKVNVVVAEWVVGMELTEMSIILLLDPVVR